MKNITETINEAKLNNKQKSYLAPMTYLIGQLYQSKDGKRNLKYMLERIDEDLYDELCNFLGEADFDNIPELLGDEEPETYLTYFDDIKPEELDKLIR